MSFVDQGVRMRAKNVMVIEVIAIPPELPAQKAWDLMVEHKVRHLPVVLNGKLCGVVSDRDLLPMLTRDKTGRGQLPEQAAGNLMSMCPYRASPETTVSQLARKMRAEKIDSVPVTTANDELLGMVTASDLLTLLVDPIQDRALPFSFRIRRTQAPTAKA
jgi:acetoin utilization protein AcuB